MAWEKGFRKLQIEVDNLCVIQLLIHLTHTINAYSSLLGGVKDFLNSDRQIILRHNYWSQILQLIILLTLL